MRAFADLAVLGTLFGSLTFLSWRKWPHVLIDFGRELYTPWQIAEGAVLYRDVASLFGPFSQYFNALLFRIAGTSFTTLVVANLVLQDRWPFSAASSPRSRAGLRLARCSARGCRS